MAHVADLGWWVRTHRTWVLGVSALLVVALGMYGFSQHVTLGQTSFLDRLYLTLQLFILGWSPEAPVPLALDVARFAAPIVSVLGAAAILGAVLAGQLGILRARFMHDHTVVCGAGKKGSELAAQLARKKQRVVVLSLAWPESGLADPTTAGVVKIRGDATQARSLRNARAHLARHVVVLCGDDGRNIEVARTAVNLSDSGDSVPRLLVHLSSEELFQLTRTADVFRMRRVEAVNHLETASRAFAARYGTGRQLVLFGGDVFCGWLVLQAARYWRTTPHAAGIPLPLILIAPNAPRTERALLAVAPTLPEIVRLRAIECEDESTAAHEFLPALRDVPERTVVAACCATEGTSVGTALRAKKAFGDAATVVACVGRTGAGLGELLTDNDYGVEPFSVAEAGADPDVLLHWRQELLARVLHTDYVRRQASTDSASLPAWDELSDDERTQDRDRAALLLTDLETFGFTVEDSLAWDVPAAVLTEVEVTTMATAEHHRWKRSLEDTGWRWSPEKDRDRKLHPDLVSWSDLSAPSKQYNLDVASELPAVLAGLGVRVERIYRPESPNPDS